MVIGMQQWGLLSTETVNFQIPFDMVFCAFAITKNNVALTDAGATIPALSVSTATMYVNGLNGYWLVVGAKNKQQWGYIQQPKGTPESSYPLPTNFTTLYMTGCCANRGAWYLDTVSFSATLTTITISTANGNVAVGYILVGMQQWGYATATVTLPLNFENTNYAVALTKADTSSGGASEAWVAVTGKTVTNFTWVGQWTTHINWFAIGRQRIKRQRYRYRDHTTLFLLILYQHHKRQLHQY